MRVRFPDVVEKGRVQAGAYASPRGERYGCFVLRAPTGAYLRLLASDGEGWESFGLPGPRWEHVSVSLPDRCPTWDELCWVKGLFWGEEECVVQFHPPKSEYVNQHPHCLHLWRPVGADMPRPPAAAVGVKGA